MARVVLERRLPALVPPVLRKLRQLGSMSHHVPVIRTVFALTLVWGGAVAHAQCEDNALQDAVTSLLLDQRTDANAIAAALLEAGSDAPHAELRRGTTREIAAWLDSLELDAPLACGTAQRDDQVWALATARGGNLDSVAGGYEVQLAEGFDEPYVVVQNDTGQMLRLGVRDGRVSVPDDFGSVTRAQLVAHGPAGPRPVAIRSSTNTSAVEMSGEGGARSRLATLRAAYNVSELRDNALLSREAQRHAERVCRERSARHVLGAGDPEQRLLRAGISARVVGEAVARARSEDVAFTAIAESPSHRMALVDRRFTDVGLGVARSRGQRCVVVTLAAWPRAIGR